MKYIIKKIDDDNIEVTCNNIPVGKGVYSHVMQEWYIYVTIGITLTDLRKIINEIDLKF